MATQYSTKLTVRSICDVEVSISEKISKSFIKSENPALEMYKTVFTLPPIFAGIENEC